MGRRNRKISAAVLIICLSVSTPVLADTTSDVYAVYNVDDTTACALQSKKLDTLLSEYNHKSEEYNYCIEYNSVIDKLNLDGLNSELMQKTEELDTLRSDIVSNGITLSYTDLLSKMGEYKTLKSNIDTLQAKLDKYSKMTPKEVPDYDFDQMASDIAQEQTLLGEIEEDSEIGDVYTLYNFLQASYTLKHEFDGTGILLKTLPDTGVLSIFSGTVIYAERNEITGETIKIDSGDGIIITYRDVSARYVQEGDVVQQYQKIATTGENLYVTLEINGVYYDLNVLYGG